MAIVKNYMVGNDVNTLQQIERMSTCEAYKDSFIAIMPDAHAGKGCTVGSTISYTDKVIPNSVGVDVSCSVSMWPIDNEFVNFEDIDCSVHTYVPSGYNVRKEEHYLSECFPYEDLYCWEHLDNHERLRLSMGSLGGGKVA